MLELLLYFADCCQTSLVGGHHYTRLRVQNCSNEMRSYIQGVDVAQHANKVCKASKYTLVAVHPHIFTLHALVYGLSPSELGTVE